MTRYYVSNYLSIIPSHRESYILFNGFKGTIDEVSKELGDALIKDQINRSNLDSDTIRFLEKRGHLTKLPACKEIKEFSRFVKKLHSEQVKKLKQQGLLMIIPSYNCNLDCSYCYQQTLRSGGRAQNKIMTIKQVDELFKNIVPQLFPKVKTKTDISVVLYGGEPFLAGNQKTLERILYYTKKYKMKVSAVTNGTEAHKMLHLFGDGIGCVGSVQISLDGDKQAHDNSRVNKQRKPTFDRIVDNIGKLLEKKVHVDIRVNTNKNSLHSLETLSTQLGKIVENPLARIYAWVISDHFDIIDKGSIITPMNLADFINMNRMPIESPTKILEEELKSVFCAQKGFPLQKTFYCMKTSPNSYVYDPFENIYSCYEEAGYVNERAGYVGKNNRVKFVKEHAVSLKRTVAAIPECLKCKLALTCGGGCPFAAKQLNGNIFSSHCNNHKECFEIAMKHLFKEYCEGRLKAIETSNIMKLTPNA